MSSQVRYKFGLAEAQDDLQLRECMARNPMGDDIKVTFRREPNYFDGCKLQGKDFEIMKCTDLKTDEIVGLGSRFFLPVFINGKPKNIGYLADLRAEAHVRHGTLLARAYKHLMERHRQRAVPFYYSLILSNNASALKQLTSARAGLPTYKYVGKLLTPAIHLDFPKPEIKISNLRFEQAQQSNLAKVIDFIQKQYQNKQLSPIYSVKDFNSGRLQGLSPHDIYVAYQGDKIIATMATWDQSFVRQTHIEGFSRGMKCLRPFYNALSIISPLRKIPAIGDRVPYVYLSMIAVDENDPVIFRALLRHVYRQCRQAQWHYAIAGLHEKDPLAKCLFEYRHIASSGELFIVHDENGKDEVEKLDERIPYVEIASI